MPGENEVKIPVELAGRIAVLLRKHAEGEARTRKKSAVLFDALKKRLASRQVVRNTPSRDGTLFAIGLSKTRTWTLKGLSAPRRNAGPLQRIRADPVRAGCPALSTCLGTSRKNSIGSPIGGKHRRGYRSAELRRARNYFFERENDSEWLVRSTKRNILTTSWKASIGLNRRS